MSATPSRSSEGEQAETEPPSGVFRSLFSGIGAWFAGAVLPREVAIVFGLALPAMLLAANMWRVHAFTVDDSFISYRYARNLTRGLGLVYNEGEHVEGYTNFLFTMILAGGIELGLDPERLSKIIGAASAFGSLGLTYAISGRITPYRTLPCAATWLLASTIVFSGWSIFGLETGFFVFLILAGTYLFMREVEPPPEAAAPPGASPARFVFPWSGVVFMLAGLTRPEAPLFIGILMIALLCFRPFEPLAPDAPMVLRAPGFVIGRFFSAQNLLRGGVFAIPIAEHLAFRRYFYGPYMLNTLFAKTGNLQGQIGAGIGYVQNYVVHAGPVLYLALLGVGIGFMGRRRDVIGFTFIGLAWLAYVVLVGGDWMKFFRFMAPFEPFCFLLIDLGVRRAVDKRDRVTNLALAIFAVMTAFWRAGSLREAQADLILHEKKFWDTAAGGTADWLVKNGKPGEVALGDIGYVGWATDYPILDLLGLVDPVISKLPGGYTQKTGFIERLFDEKPRYVLIISSNLDCAHPSVSGSIVMFGDKRFRQQYQVAGKVPLDGGFAWCIYERK